MHQCFHQAIYDDDDDGNAADDDDEDDGVSDQFAQSITCHLTHQCTQSLKDNEKLGYHDDDDDDCLLNDDDDDDRLCRRLKKREILKKDTTSTARQNVCVSIAFKLTVIDHDKGAKEEEGR